MATSNSNDCGCFKGIQDLVNAPLDPSGVPIGSTPANNRNPISRRAPEPGNTLSTALNLGQFSQRRTLTRADSTTNRDQDLYRLTLTQGGTVSLRVTNLSTGQPITASILNSRGQVARDVLGNALATRLNNGTTAFTQAIPTGTYYLKIVGLKQAVTSYRFSLNVG